MSKNVKILIIGAGSIGRRHFMNLKKMGYNNLYVFDTDSSKIIPSAKRVDDLSQNTLSQFHIVFVCSPTSLHVKIALDCAKAGCHLFIEKPISNKTEGIGSLVKICREKKLVNMVACNLRFEPCLKKIKELLDKGYLGKVYAIYLEYGRYLPYQRMGIDYKKVYASQKKLGGGIILDDIHDFDLMFWFNNFKKLKNANIISTKASSLRMDVEDIASAIFLFENNVLGSVRCDYLQQYKHKDCRIIGEKGNLAWDFRENTVYFEYFDKNKEKSKKIFSPKKTDPYVGELKYFLGCVSRKQNTFNSVEDSFEVLKAVVKNI